MEFGIPLEDDRLEPLRVASGISVNATLARARGMPFLGQYVAELSSPDDSPVTFERTGSGRGPYTLWGEPVDFLAHVSAVHMVRYT